MDKTTATVSQASSELRSLRENVYRYLFYGWMFRDADRGSELERALALQHNKAQARWMPIYLVRWLVIGGVLWQVEQASESMASPFLPIVLSLALIYVAMYVLLTTVYWSFLRGKLRGGGR
ncbi:hypothetical protein [Rhizobacter fulvus]